MVKVKYIFSFLFVIFIISGCYQEAVFEIVNVQEAVKSYGSPYLIITVQNTGPRPGWGVTCDVRAYGPNQTILDTAWAYFASGNTINPGESAEGEAIFFDLASHTDYLLLDYELNWFSGDSSGLY